MKQTKQIKSARECALTLLEYQNRTEQEMRRKLQEREYDAAEIEKALSFLKEYHFIDDLEYAGTYIRIYSARKSIRQIRFDLERKGIARELIDKKLEENPVDEETQILLLMQKKGYRPGERMEPDAYRKMVAALCRKGYPYDAVRRATVQMCEASFEGRGIDFM